MTVAKFGSQSSPKVKKITQSGNTESCPYLVIKVVSGQGDDAGSGVQRESVHAPVRNEGVRDGAGRGASVEVGGLDAADDGASLGVLENVEREGGRLERGSVVVDVLNLDKSGDIEKASRSDSFFSVTSLLAWQNIAFVEGH